LSGTALSDSRVHDSLGQHCQLEDEPELGNQRIPGGKSCRGQHPGGAAQAVAYWGWPGHAPVCAPGGAVVGGGSSPQLLVAEGAGSGVQGVGGGPGGVGRRAGVGRCKVADVLCGVAGCAGGMVVDGVAFGVGEPGGVAGCGGGCPAVAQFGQGQVGASLPPLYQIGPPVAAVLVERATA